MGVRYSIILESIYLSVRIELPPGTRRLHDVISKDVQLKLFIRQGRKRT